MNKEFFNRQVQMVVNDIADVVRLMRYGDVSLEHASGASEPLSHQMGQVAFNTMVAECRDEILSGIIDLILTPRKLSHAAMLVLLNNPPLVTEEMYPKIAEILLDKWLIWSLETMSENKEVPEQSINDLFVELTSLTIQNTYQRAATGAATFTPTEDEANALAWLLTLSDNMSAVELDECYERVRLELIAACKDPKVMVKFVDKRWRDPSSFVTEAIIHNDVTFVVKSWRSAINKLYDDMKAQRKAMTVEAIKENNKPHVEGTTAELAAKYGLSKSEVRRRKQQGIPFDAVI